MPAPNILSDFDPAKFTTYGFCADCNHSAVVPRLDENMTIPALKASLRCSACGSHDTSIRICYTGAGEFQWGKSHPNG
jgi:primosomal protein N'